MKKIFWFFVGFWLAFSFGIGISYAEWQARIAWTPNVEGDLQYYTVYVGLDSRSYYPPSYEVGLDGYTGFTIPEIFEDGVMHYFSVTATNWGGYESDYSNEVRSDGTHSPGPPNPPIGCYIEVIRLD